MRWLALLLALAAFSAQGDEALWNLLAGGGQVLFVRHGQTSPGVGDPVGFKLEDCATQRNLSAEGRAQAQRLGAEFRRRGIPLGELLSSPWCRCHDTAKLAFGPAKSWTALSNLFGRHGAAEQQVSVLRPRIAGYKGKANLILVSHGSTAAALTGEHPAMGEMLVLTPAGKSFRVAGRISVP